MNNKSFTLIEILVVIVVIGVLSAFILVGMSSISSKANIAKGQAFINSMDSSLLLARISQWKLDEASGTTMHDVWGLNDGTLGDGTCTSGVGTCPIITSIQCISNNCLSFDGGDYVNCGSGSNFDLTTAFTMSLWAKPSIITSGNRTIFYRGNSSTVGGYAINQEGVNFRVYFYDTTWRATSLSITAATVNNWYHIVGTYNKSTLKLYINGTNERSSDFLTDINIASGATTRIGDASGTQRFNGFVDDVRIYNQAIPTSQIQQNYFLGLNNLYKNKGLTQIEYTQRLTELKTNLTQD
jgi:prepilin-type N-terminal cleavage/methylation domain-containing protein